MKTFSVAGTSQDPQGNLKIRFANDFVDRFKKLIANGHTCVNLVDLGSQLTKAECCLALLDHPQFQSQEDQMAIFTYMERNRKTLEEDHFAHKAVRAIQEHQRQRVGA